MLERLAEGWLPSDDFDEESRAVSEEPRDLNENKEWELPTVGEALVSPEVKHYLYFPSEDLASSAGDVLKGQDYDVDVRTSGDDESWLVAVTFSPAELSEEALDQVASFLTDFAASQGGRVRWLARVG